MNISLEKTLPNNLEAERALLGAILIDCAMPSDARVEDFYLEAHRRILETMRQMDERNETIDLVALKNALQMKNQLELVGGAVYLAALTDGLPRIDLAPQYLRIIREKASLRRLIHMGNEVMTRAYSDEDLPGEIISAAMEGIDHATMIIDEDTGLRPIGDFVSPVFEELEMRANKKTSDAWATGFVDLDRMMSGGIRKQNLAIIAGRPGHGKTAFLTSMLLNMAKRGTNCAFFSLEMGAMEIVERMLCVLSRVDGGKMRTGFLNREDWAAISQAAGELSSYPIYIDDTPALSVADLRSRIRRVRPKHKNGVGQGEIEIVGVDYLQLMSPPDRLKRSTDDNAVTSAISKGLDNLAKVMNVGLLAVSQLSRASEKRTDRRPQLSDLRNSGQIEQDADVVMFVYRQEMGSPTEENTGMAEIILAKQRNGPIADIKLAFEKQCTAFHNLYSETK